MMNTFRKLLVFTKMLDRGFGSRLYLPLQNILSTMDLDLSRKSIGLNLRSKTLTKAKWSKAA